MSARCAQVDMMFQRRRKTSRIINDLHSACQDKPLPEERILELIKEYPQAVEIRGNDGWLPIHRVCRRQPSKKLVLAFLKATPASKDSLKEWTADGITDLGARLPIHLACQFGAPLPTVKFMVTCLEESMNAACLDHNMTPLDYAYQAQEYDDFEETDRVIEWLESSIPASQRRPRISRPAGNTMAGNQSAADLPINTPDTTNTEGSTGDDTHSHELVPSTLTSPAKRTDTGTTVATGGSHSLLTNHVDATPEGTNNDMEMMSERKDGADPSENGRNSSGQEIRSPSVLIPPAVYDHRLAQTSSSQAEVSSVTSFDQQSSNQQDNRSTQRMASARGGQESQNGSVDTSTLSSVSSIPLEQVTTAGLPVTSEVTTASAAMGSFSIPSFSNPRAKTKDYRLNPIKKKSLEKYSRKLLEEGKCMDDTEATLDGMANAGTKPPHANKTTDPLSAVFSSHQPNFVILGDSGKPLYARYGNESEIARICGLFSALRGSIRYGPQQDDLLAIRSDNLLLVFLHVQSVTLVALADPSIHTKAFLQMQLEYLYSIILFRLTDQVQLALQQHHSLDFATMLSSMNLPENEIDDALHDFLAKTDTTARDGSFLPFGLFCGSHSVAPLSRSLRQTLTSTLHTVGSQTPNTVFALVVVVNSSLNTPEANDGDYCFESQPRLMSIIQPDYAPHLMRSSDLHILLQFIQREVHSQSKTTDMFTDLPCMWKPICLPRFHSTGFLHCFAQRLDHDNDMETGLTLVLVSTQGSLEQRSHFERAATQIRQKLEFCKVNTEEDYVDVDAAGDGDKMIPYVASDAPPPLLQELKASLLDEDSFWKDYMGDMIHFCARFNAPIQASPRPRRGMFQPKQPQQGNPTIGYLSQYVTSPRIDAADGDIQIVDIWKMYQTMSLRLRVSSATDESVMAAWNMIQSTSTDSSGNGLGNDQLSATVLMESKPHSVTGMVYQQNEGYVYFAMSGSPDFELYFCVDHSTALSHAAKMGAKLVRRIMLEQDTLFMTRPGTFRE